jgi:hypothetical protein
LTTGAGDALSLKPRDASSVETERERAGALNAAREKTEMITHNVKYERTTKGETSKTETPEIDTYLCTLARCTETRASSALLLRERPNLATLVKEGVCERESPEPALAFPDQGTRCRAGAGFGGVKAEITSHDHPEHTEQTNKGRKNDEE